MTHLHRRTLNSFFHPIWVAVLLVSAGFGQARAENVTLYLKGGDKITGFVVSEYTNRIVLSNSWVRELSVPLTQIDRREIAMGGTNHIEGTNALAKIKAAKVVPAAPPPLFKYWKGEAEVGLDFGLRHYRPTHVPWAVQIILRAALRFESQEFFP